MSARDRDVSLDLVNRYGNRQSVQLPTLPSRASYASARTATARCRIAHALTHFILYVSLLTMYMLLCLYSSYAFYTPLILYILTICCSPHSLSSPITPPIIDYMIRFTMRLCTIHAMLILLLLLLLRRLLLLPELDDPNPMAWVNGSHLMTHFASFTFLVSQFCSLNCIYLYIIYL